MIYNIIRILFKKGFGEKRFFFLTFEKKNHIDKSITANTYKWEQTEYLVMCELDYLKER